MGCCSKGGGETTPSGTSRCSILLPCANVRSSGDVIAFEGPRIQPHQSHATVCDGQQRQR